MAQRRNYSSKSKRLGDRILAEIAGGTHKQGQLLPPETTLCTTYGASRVTIRRILDRLAARGFLQRIPHRGVIVKAGAAGQVPAVISAPVITGDKSSRRQILLGSVLAAQPDEGLVSIQEGIDQYAGEHGLGLQYISLKEDGQPFRKLSHADDLGVDGLILLPYPGAEHLAVLRAIREKKIPAVCVERRSSRVPLPSVEPDSSGGMYCAVNYLLRKYRRPVYFLGMRCDHQTDIDRLHGYTCAMRDAGFAEQAKNHTVLHALGSSDPRYWAEPCKWLHGYEAAQRLLDKASTPLSVACVKDYVAWGLYKAAEERDLTIGRDILVTGFDDLTIAQLLSPPLTTIHQSLREKGYRAAQLLHRQIATGIEPPPLVKLPVKLIIRESA
ncbi:MAG TPA: GntR family transcriptional regulator [Planctomycetota bacterium]|jgi:LacI family transcriptional regulator